MWAILLALSSERVLLFATRLLGTAFLLVVAKARASIPEVNCTSKGRVLAWMAPPVKEEEEGMGQWYLTNVEAEPKVSPWAPDARCSRSMVSWDLWAHCFQATHVLVEGGLESHTGR